MPVGNRLLININVYRNNFLCHNKVSKVRKVRKFGKVRKKELILNAPFAIHLLPNDLPERYTMFRKTASVIPNKFCLLIGGCQPLIVILDEINVSSYD
jgi:hypothetical protein